MSLIGKKILKRAEAMEKSIHKQKEKFAYLFVRERGERDRERGRNSFEITVIILKYI